MFGIEWERRVGRGDVFLDKEGGREREEVSRIRRECGECIRAARLQGRES